MQPLLVDPPLLPLLYHIFPLFMRGFAVCLLVREPLLRWLPAYILSCPQLGGPRLDLVPLFCISITFFFFGKIAPCFPHRGCFCFFFSSVPPSSILPVLRQAIPYGRTRSLFGPLFQRGSPTLCDAGCELFSSYRLTGNL